MRCDDVRLALSAHLDDEDMVAPSGTVNDHLDGCPACRAWLSNAERVTRVVRVRSVEVPDLTARILAAVHADGSLPAGRGVRAAVSGPVAGVWRALGGSRGRAALRWALGVVAIGQAMLAVPDLLGAVGHEAHAGREVAAFDIALSVGLLVVACYPEYARVFAPVVLTLVVCFASASALDVMQGVVTPSRVAIHAVAVAQAGLVWMLARTGTRQPAPA